MGKRAPGMFNRQAWRTLEPWAQALFQQRLRLLIGFALMVVTAIAGVGLLGVSGWFISASALFVVAFDIFIPGGAIRALALLRTVSRYGERVKNHDLVLRLQNVWRIRMFSQLMELPLLRSERLRVAHVLQRLTQDLNALDDLYLRLLGPLFSAFLCSLLVGVLFFLLHPMLGFALWVASLIGIWWFTCQAAARLHVMAQQELETSEALRSATHNFVERKAELHAWNILQTALSEVKQPQAELEQAQYQLRTRLHRLQAVLEIISHLVLVALLAGALHLALLDTFSVPLAILVGFAVLGLNEVWAALPQAALLWGRVQGAATRLGTWHEKADSEVKQTVHETGAPPPAIYLDSALAEGRPTLSGALTLHIEAGQWVYIRGRSGGGKTTLLYLLTNVLPLASGTRSVKVAGEHTEDVPFAFLTQQTTIYSATVAQNLRMGRENIHDDELWNILERVELADAIEELDDQLYTWLGDGGVQLSGGQQRRLALARTLLSDAKFMVLDEPFTGVSEAQAARIWRKLASVLVGKTLICATHHTGPLALPAKLAERVQLMQQPIELCYDSPP